MTNKLLVNARYFSLLSTLFFPRKFEVCEVYTYDEPSRDENENCYFPRGTKKAKTKTGSASLSRIRPLIFVVNSTKLDHISSVSKIRKRLVMAQTQSILELP